VTNEKRKFHVPLAELLDRLTVDQIKEVLLDDGKESYADEIRILQHDIDLIINYKNIPCTSRLLRLVAIIAQMNLHIWYLKDRMQEDQGKYDDHLRLAHQLNGIRNRIKNLLLEETGDSEISSKHSNLSTDGLNGWNVSI
jgi:hypothetical protein